MNEAPVAVATVVSVASAHPAITAVELIGSRAAGDPTALSDWDFALDTDDPDAVIATLPATVAAMQPLATFWDPLSTRWNLIVLVDGPHKVDLILDHPHGPGRAPAVDPHFWDWVLWLGSKHLRGQHDLVDRELTTLHRHLLQPLGVEERPATIDQAVRAYGRTSAIARQVTEALAAAGVIRPR